MKKAKKVLLAMSGGIDSSVSAYLLKKQGYEVMGVHFRLLEKKNEETMVRAICKQLDIKFYPVNVRDKFKKEVIDYFISSYEKGETPNPCTRCNKVVKFAELIRLADELGFEFVATGHYSIIKNEELRINNQGREEQGYQLLRGRDDKKDQSYFLYRLGQEELCRIIFPLGEMTKDEVRVIAEEQNFPHFKGESQDICFLVKNGKIIDHNEFLKKEIVLKPGKIVDQDGKVLGKHQGLPLYTIGQRKGVEIGGTGPYYVVKTDYKNNTLHVSNDSEDQALFSDEFFVKEVNWTAGEEPELPLKCDVVVRYQGKALPGVIQKATAEELLAHSMECAIECAVYKVKIKRPERAVTSGQSAVFYHRDSVMGGGVIQN